MFADKALPATDTTSDSSTPNLTSSRERTVTPPRTLMPLIPMKKSKPSGMSRITSALTDTDGLDSNLIFTWPVPTHSKRSPLIVVMLTLAFLYCDHMGAYTIHLVQLVSTRASHFTRQQTV
ncbi:hypothetical protein E2C01_064219 [Portunus trituberculatus]|uniref:Uncharacterized protein n=1 Tax=Portunus trituberculatus TaxID=210409 RepID=A0A5B7HJ62_PORTR|nr:hypothetical protein [Portunus trituberculatus]